MAHSMHLSIRKGSRMAISNLTKRIVCKYLYGTEEKPDHIATGAIIRAENVTTTHSVPLSAYLAGPGRFARATMSSLVDQFFRPHMYELNGQPLPHLPPGEYSKDDLRTAYENSSFGIYLTQWQYADDSDDIAERTFLWNSSALQLADDIVFVVETNGTRRIDNLAIVPLQQSDYVENFDLVTHQNDWIASLGNQFIIKPKMDTFGIGRRVNINFTGSPPSGHTYTQDDFEEDLLLTASQYSSLPPIGLLAGINDILDELWDEGITQFLDQDGLPIVYGTVGSNTINASDAPNNPYIDTLLNNNPGLGVVLIGAGGADELNGGDNDDLLAGGAGADEISGAEGWNLADYRDSEDGVDVDLSRATQVGGDAEGDSLSDIAGVLGSEEADVLHGSGDGIYLGGGGGDDYIAVAGNFAQVSDGEGEDTIAASGGRVFVALEDDSASDTVISGREMSLPFGGGDTDRLVVRLSDLRIAAWIIANGTAPTEGQFAADKTRSVAIRGGVKDEYDTSPSYYARSSLDYDYVDDEPQSQAVWAQNDWDSDHPPANLEIASFIQPAGWLRVMVCLMLSSPLDLETPLVETMTGLSYPLRTAYDSVQSKTVVIGFAVADISIDEFEEGRFGMTLYEGGSAAAFSHIWNGGEYVSVPDGPPTLS